MLKNMEPGGKVRHTKKCLIQAVMKIASGARRARTEMTALENRFHFRQASSANRKSVVVRTRCLSKRVIGWVRRIKWGFWIKDYPRILGQGWKILRIISS